MAGARGAVRWAGSDFRKAFRAGLAQLRNAGSNDILTGQPMFAWSLANDRGRCPIRSSNDAFAVSLEDVALQFWSIPISGLNAELALEMESGYFPGQARWDASCLASPSMQSPGFQVHIASGNLAPTPRFTFTLLT